MKFLNLILCSKNDNYCGKPIDRLKVSLENNLKNLSNYSNWKIHVVDWGSDEKIEDVLNIKHKNLQFYYIPKEVTSKINSPLSEVHALNYIAKKCENGFIGRIDQDTFVGEKFLNWFFNDSEDNKFYFGRRSDLPPNELDISKAVNPYVNVKIHDCAVGILLIPQKIWHESTGYDEKNIHFNHMEREFIFRLKQRYEFIDLTPFIESDFYHIWHERSTRINETNQWFPDEVLSQINYIANDATWGLINV